MPKVEVAQPGLLFVPIGGAVGYYGGEAPLSERVAKELNAWSGYRIGVAVGLEVGLKVAVGPGGVEFGGIGSPLFQR